MRRGIWLAAIPLIFAQAAPQAADPWTGRPRSEVVALLGEPDRASNGRGGETLTYKLLRLRDGADPGPELIALDVPGVGRVARVVRTDDPFRGETVTIEPVGIDARGHAAGGGVTTERKETVSWDPKDGPPPSIRRPRELPVAGKVKLTFQMDAAGRVRSWSASPPPRTR